ncbi:TPA: hypothetical protein ACH3X2_004300 [Trebouxia sp. C0005]
MHGTTNLTKHVPKEALLRPDVFLVITAECIWPVFSFWQQKQLCELAKEFCYTELGVQGPLIQVYGDMLPPSDFLIIVPRTREVPDMITAASKFIHACQKLWALNVQLQLGQLAVFDTSDPQLSRQCIKPNSCPHTAAWRRINMSHRPVSVQLLANLSPKDATVFAVVTDAASQTTAKSLSVSTGEALSPILDEVEQRMYIPAGTLAEEYTEGGVVTLARDEMVFMLLVQAEVATEASRVKMYRVISTM